MSALQPGQGQRAGSGGRGPGGPWAEEDLGDRGAWAEGDPGAGEPGAMGTSGVGTSGEGVLGSGGTWGQGSWATGTPRGHLGWEGPRPIPEGGRQPSSWRGGSRSQWSQRAGRQGFSLR